MMGSGKGKSIEIILPRYGAMPLHACQYASCPEHLTTLLDDTSFAHALCIRKSLTSQRKLLLMYQCNSLKSQFLNGFRLAVRRGMEDRKETQSIVIHAAKKHGFRFEKLEFGSPCGIGNLELSDSLFCFRLASCQITMLKELPSMVILNLGAAGTCVFE